MSTERLLVSAIAVAVSAGGCSIINRFDDYERSEGGAGGALIASPGGSLGRAGESSITSSDPVSDGGTAGNADGAGNPLATECGPRTILCGGFCIPIDVNNCGECGNKCFLGEACVDALCSCAPPYVVCNDTCVDVTSSPAHCGQCGHACLDPEPLCSGGTCSSTCAQGETACDGACVDLETNEGHCGSCTVSCSSDETCESGECVCNSPRVDCDGTCVDIELDAANCGGCNTECQSGQCLDGTCVEAAAGGSGGTGPGSMETGGAATGGQAEAGAGAIPGGYGGAGAEGGFGGEAAGGASETGGAAATGATATGGAGSGGTTTGGAPAGGSGTGGTETGGAATGGASTGGAATGGSATGGAGVEFGTWRVSVSSTGVEADSSSNSPSISGDGRLVAFGSSATTLISGDANARTDVFVREPSVPATTRVSVASNGDEGDDGGSDASLGSEGRFIAFTSSSTNLVAVDANSQTDVFVHDRETGGTSLVSMSAVNAQGDGGSDSPAISADGRYVAFRSSATNLVTADTNAVPDVFLRDRQAATTTRVSISNTGAQSNNMSGGAALSADARIVAFNSSATNLVSNDTNANFDVFVRDRQAATTIIVSIDSDGTQANGFSESPSVSADGQRLAFYSSATNLVPGDTNGAGDIFVHDLSTRTTTRVSVASDGAQASTSSTSPCISGNGRFVAFQSAAANLVPNDTNDASDVFVHDLETGTTTRVSVSTDGSEATGVSGNAALSLDGSWVAFDSFAANLIADDFNGSWDVFVRRWR